MQLLEERILQDGQVRPGNVLKVDCFLNHQLDIALLDEIGTTDLPPVTSGGTTLTPLAAIADEHTLKPLRGRRFRGILSIAK